MSTVFGYTEDSFNEVSALVGQETAANVLFATVGEGFEAGSFTSKMIEATLYADVFNLMKICSTFSDIAVAVDIYKHLDGGVDMLRKIAAGE